MKIGLVTIAAGMLAGLWAGPASAQGYLVSNNGRVAIGVNATGYLDTNAAALGGPRTQGSGGLLGIAYDFAGIGGRTGFQDALSPGCLCEGLGVAGNGAGSYVNGSFGNSGITYVSDTFVPGTSHTSVVNGAAGLTVTQVVTRSAETGTGALFQAAVTIANTTAATVSDVMYARVMDWDVPVTEFREYVTHAGVSLGGTSNLLRATDNGFATGNPITGLSDPGIAAAPNTNGDQGGIADHGSLFVFGFGDLAAGASTTFNIFYGAGRDLSDAISLLTQVGAELYSLGQSSVGGVRGDDRPTYIFAFNGVGLPPVTTVPEPATLGLFGLGLFGLAAARRRRAV